MNGARVLRGRVTLFLRVTAPGSYQCGMTTAELKSRIDSILAELTNRILQEVSRGFTHEILGAKAAAPAPAPRAAKPATQPAAKAPKSAPKRARGKGKKGSAADGRRLPAETRAAAEKFAAYVAANPGLRIRQIGPALGMSTDDLALPVTRALSYGWVRKEGERSATAYFPPQ